MLYLNFEEIRITIIADLKIAFSANLDILANLLFHESCSYRNFIQDMLKKRMIWICGGEVMVISRYILIKMNLIELKLNCVIHS